MEKIFFKNCATHCCGNTNYSVAILRRSSQVHLQVNQLISKSSTSWHVESALMMPVFVMFNKSISKICQQTATVDTHQLVSTAAFITLCSLFVIVVIKRYALYNALFTKASNHSQSVSTSRLQLAVLKHLLLSKSGFTPFRGEWWLITSSADKLTFVVVLKTYKLWW